MPNPPSEPERRHLEVRAAAEQACAFARCRDQISEGAGAVVGVTALGRPVLYHEGCYADALLAARDQPRAAQADETPRAGAPGGKADPLGHVGGPSDPMGRWGGRRD